MSFKKTSKAILVVLLISSIAILYIPSINKGVYHLIIDYVLEESVPYINGKDINIDTDKILDTRSFDEYQVSHIPNAIWAGEHTAETLNISKDAKIIVYCSLGKRSEQHGKILIESGYTNVHNLYGGIIEWHNNEMITVNSAEVLTDFIHPYSWFWGLWIR